VEGGRWKVEGERWKVEGGRWKVEGGQDTDLICSNPYLKKSRNYRNKKIFINIIL
jgi:hypothetical protein